MLPGTGGSELEVLPRLAATVRRPGKGKRVIADTSGYYHVRHTANGVAGQRIVRTACRNIAIEYAGRPRRIFITHLCSRDGCRRSGQGKRRRQYHEGAAL